MRPAGDRAVGAVPSGERRGRPRSRGGGADIAEVHRARILDAMVYVAAEEGYARATVASVTRRAGVSRKSFYELFDDRDACYTAAFEDVLGQARARVAEAYHPRAPWAQRMRSALTALLTFLEEERRVGALLLAEPLDVTPRLSQVRSQLLTELISAIDAGRKQPGANGQVPQLSAEGLIGAAAAIVRARLRGGEGALLELVNPVMSLIVLPYLGSKASARELAKPLPSPTPEREDGPRIGSLGRLDLRLTYRTMRVLEAIGTQPCASNRVVAESAGITDAGQTSKLLRRLADAGLIRQTARAAPGERYAWALTADGRRLVGAVTQASESTGHARSPEHIPPLAPRRKRP